MEGTKKPSRLSKEQHARIEAMAAVAPYCREAKFMNISSVDPFDLIRLSEYVMKGEVE